MSTRTMPEAVVTPHFPLAAVLWPHRADGASAVLRSVILIVLGTALLTLSAKVSLPLPYVPMTLQTLVVLMIGAAYGWRLGSATLLAYLAEGAIGLPVFAGPVGGIAPLVGPTAGYLFGFVGAAFVTGWLAERGLDRRYAGSFIAMLAGLALIFISGLSWLAFFARPVGGSSPVGLAAALATGLYPFLVADIVKLAVAAGLVPAVWRVIGRPR